MTKDLFNKFDEILANDPIAGETIGNDKSLKCLMNPKVMGTFQTLERGEVHGGDDATHIFWANNYDPETKIHHGNRNANYYADKEAETGRVANTLATYDDVQGTGVVNLMRLESDPTEEEYDKQLIYAASSRNFAMSSNDRIATSVQGANPNSFF